MVIIDQDALMEIFLGYGCSLIITAPTKPLLTRISIEFSAQLALPYGGIEAGINSFLLPAETPDNRYGVKVSLWSHHHSDFSHLIHHLGYRIKSTLFPRLGIRVFSAILQSTTFFDTAQELRPLCGQFTRIVKAFDRELVLLPLMGGDFEIESRLGIVTGFLGANLFLGFRSINDAIKMEPEITGFFLTSPNITQIYGFVGSGSRVNNTKIESNLPYCPTLRESLGSVSRVSPNVQCFIEIIINGYFLDEIQAVLKKFFIQYAKDSRIEQISAGSYNNQLGQITLQLRDFL